ncbi:hypothetical protein GCK72_003358 [Caenorhabditis remanei]|uniref:Uncharacterized protein n=1 Tax=Caenorhabditis remanei TaxID=31234 RepID=A0A6A5HW96_CAERE|nr:hypothetical protein GCK72_003358 [Caenorhabditis remanei]KAF1771531.1 hypothetical protein GCK72_003358 [Caenorhabditis remanei]
MNEEEHRLYMRKMKERSRQKKKDLIAQKKIEEPAQTPPVQFQRSRQGTPYPNWSDEDDRVPEYADEKMVVDGAEQQSDSEYEEFALEEANERSPLPPTEGSSGCSGNRISACSHEVSIEEPVQSSSGHLLGSRQRTSDSNGMEKSPEHGDELMIVDEEPNAPEYSSEGLALEKANELPPLPPTEGSSGCSGSRISARSPEISAEEPAQSPPEQLPSSHQGTPNSNRMEYEEQGSEYADEQVLINGTEEPNAPEYAAEAC